MLYFSFAIRKILQILWKIFLIPSLYILEKRNKWVTGKINLYYLTSWKMAKFFLQKCVIFNIITDSFLVEKWGVLERPGSYASKNLLNLDYQNSIRFGIFQVTYKWGKSFAKSFSFPFSAKCFDRNFKCIFYFEVLSVYRLL